METLTVELGERSYPIHIGPGLIKQPALLMPAIQANRVLIVSNETVAPLYLKQIRATLGERTVDDVILPDGESYKTLDTLKLIYDALLEGNYARDCTLIALGGGVVGDICGFAAATYQRGVDFIQIPTTLLAQVDSSVGGKTAVNHPLGKNMIGAFHQPKAVIADTDTLSSLPEREFLAGMAEVIKYGLLGDLQFLDWLEANMASLLAREDHALMYAIRRSCENKSRIVAEDERVRLDALRAHLESGVDWSAPADARTEGCLLQFALYAPLVELSVAERVAARQTVGLHHPVAGDVVGGRQDHRCTSR